MNYNGWSVLLASLIVVCGAAASSACGPSPAASNAEAAPSGTLVVVIVTGPDRVPFHPKLDRIRKANEQLTTILGHSIRIELDGSLLPQTQDGAEDVIARLVEDIARDLDALEKEDKNKAALVFAREHFEKIVVRYAPVEAAAREERWQRRSDTGAKLDPSTKTIDVVRPEARWTALERGQIASVIYRAFSAGKESRYANVLPDALPSGEHRNWFDFHTHDVSFLNARSKEKVGSVNGLTVRGVVTLTRDADAALAKDARQWLIDQATGDFAQIYHHNAPEVESAPSSSSYRQAESAYVGWVKSELPRMTIEERGKIASHLWVTDFRKDSGERDRFATYAFPGLDLMTFSFDTIDAWIAAGHPPNTKQGTREIPPLFDTVVCPANMETRSGQIHFSELGRCDGTFYRWAFANKTREDALVKGMIARGADVPFATAAFYNARRSLREENEYLRFLHRFETTPTLWKVGADVHREVVYRPSAGLLEESRRLWREVPIARGHVLLWFARHGEGSYHPDSDWPDLIQGAPADDAALGAFLDLGWDGFWMLPASWPGLAKNNNQRMRRIEAKAKELLGGARVPGRPSVSGTLVEIARLLCDDRAMGELAELRSFAQAELPKFPGAGLSDVVEAADPAGCKPKARAALAPTRPPAAKKPPKRAPGSEGKEPLDSRQ